MFVAVTALIIAIVSLSFDRKVVHKEISIQDEAVKLENGIIYAKGFSNEPYKTNKQATVVQEDQIRANKLSDGLSEMSGGHLSVADRVKCMRFTDGTLNIQHGTVTTTGSIIADELTATRSLNIPSKNYAYMLILEMQQVNFNNKQEWKEIAENTKGVQWFFPGHCRAHDGVTICKNNRIQLHKQGRWRYQFGMVVAGKGECAVAATLDKEEPKIGSGFGAGTNVVNVNGFGIVDVSDTDSLYRMFFQHTQKPSSGEYGLSVVDAHVLVEFMGR